jgi:hypothetical protein
MLAWAVLNSLYKQQIWTTLRDLIGQGVYQLLTELRCSKI